MSEDGDGRSSSRPFTAIATYRVLDFIDTFPDSIRESIRSAMFDALLRTRWRAGWVDTARDRVWLERGELIVGRNTTAKRLGVSLKRYRTIFRHLRDARFWRIREDQPARNRFTVLELPDYDLWCPVSASDEQQSKGQQDANEAVAEGASRRASKTDGEIPVTEGDSTRKRRTTGQRKGQQEGQQEGQRKGHESTCVPDLHASNMRSRSPASETVRTTSDVVHTEQRELPDVQSPTTPVERWLRVFFEARPFAGHPLGGLSAADVQDATWRVEGLIDAHKEKAATEMLRVTLRSRPVSVKQAVMRCEQLSEATPHRVSGDALRDAVEEDERKRSERKERRAQSDAS